MIFRRLGTNVDGSVAVESAIIFTVFVVPLLLSLLDAVLLYQGQAEVDMIQQNAVSYVMSAGSNATADGVQAATKSAAGASISVAASLVCYCVSTGTTVPTMPTPVSCPTTCGDSAVFQQFMNIVTTSQVALPFQLPWIALPSPATVKSSSLVRTG